MATRKSTLSFDIGDWVVTKSEGLDLPGPFRVLSIDGDRVTVAASSYPDHRFENRATFKKRDLLQISKIEGLSIWYPLAQETAWVHGVGLLRERDKWLIGVDGQSEVEWIQIGDGDNSQSQKSIWIKDFRMSPKPIEMLRRGMSTEFSQMQVARDYRKWLQQQAIASAGFSAVMSAPIKPVHHQLNVAARVLGDQRLRFLLADEVGMGKTIEAGLIIRQLILDGNSPKVIVLVPGSLVFQWKRELGEKLGLQKWIENSSLQILSHDQVTDSFSADILIVDEAHRFCSGEENENLFADLERNALAIPRLLMLSATPLRSDPIVLLQLLSLIDSRNYSMRDEVSFRARFDARIAQAKALNLLSPTNSVEIRKVLVENIRAHIPPDEVVENLLSRVLEEETDSRLLASTIETLKSEIEERFRISRRMVRNRRSAIDASDYPLPGRTHEFIEIEDPEISVVLNFVETWRERSQNQKWENVESIFIELLNSAIAGSWALRDWVKQRYSVINQETGKPSFDTESSLLGEYQFLLPAENHRVAAIILHFADLLANQMQNSRVVSKVVICSGFSSQAEHIYAQLSDQFGDRIAAHLESRSHEENDCAVQRFVRSDEVRILVIDAGAEEGLNLQVANKIINVDIPWSVNRLEQRLGRIDRFTDANARDAVCSIVLESGNDLMVEFARFLELGTGVLSESVATAQKTLSYATREFAKEIWRSGLSSLNFDLEQIREQIEIEKDEVMELEDLESQNAFGEFSAEDYELLQAFEANIETNCKAFNVALENLGIFKNQLQSKNEVVEFKFANSKQRPPILPAIRHSHLSEVFSGSATFDRTSVLDMPGTSLIRLGNSMVEEIKSLFRHDDQRLVAIGWVVDREMSKPFTEMEIEVEVSPDFSFLRKMLPLADFRRVRRRVGSAFPDQTIILRLDQEGNPSSHDGPFWSETTVPLNGKSLQEVIDRQGNFAVLAESIEMHFESWVKNQIAEHLEKAIDVTIDDHRRRVKSLKTWKSGDVRDEIELEIEIADEVIGALMNPIMRVQSIAVVIHSYEPLDSHR